MADVLGRRPLYLITLAIYICANIGLALTEVYWLLMVLRCVQATGSASMIALSQGSVADIASPSERGGMVAIANSGAMLAPAIGPVIGSLLVSTFSSRISSDSAPSDLPLLYTGPIFRLACYLLVLGNRSCGSLDSLVLLSARNLAKYCWRR